MPYLEVSLSFRPRKKRSAECVRLRTTMRPLIWSLTVLALGACAEPQCSNTSFGNGVVCVRAHGEGSPKSDETARTVELRASSGNAVIVVAYQCWDALCATTGSTTLTISDNINSPETCFTKSPNSPFTLVESSAGAQHIQQYIWFCPSIPGGVSRFTVTCSAMRSCSYITVWVMEWTGLTADPTVEAFDTDGSAASTIRGTEASVSTRTATRYTKDLVIACGDNTDDRTMSPGAPYLEVNQFFPGNMCMATTVDASGSVQTATSRWMGDDDWYFVIAAIRSAGSAPAVAGSRDRAHGLR